MFEWKQKNQVLLPNLEGSKDHLAQPEKGHCELTKRNTHMICTFLTNGGITFAAVSHVKDLHQHLGEKL